MMGRLKEVIFIDNEFFFFSLIRKIKTEEEYKRLFSNFLSLSVLQAANYIFPLITFPYLVRVLGVEKFGLISFAQAFIAYFNILTDYGFNLSATREISINRDNKEKINEIFSSVMFIKFGLLILSFIIMSGIVFGFEKFRKDWFLYYLTFGMVLGQVLFPVWFFQGIEQMKWITYMNVIAKGIFTVAIFVFVKSAEDYYKVPLLNSVGFITAGILSLWLTYNHFKVNFKLPKISEIVYHIKEGLHIFVSMVLISLYTTSTTFILGIFTNNTVVGYFASADKIIQVFKTLIFPISNVIYPHINYRMNKSVKDGISFLKKSSLIIGVITFFVSLLIFIFSEELVYIILGYEYHNSIIFLRIMSFLPFIIGMSNVFGIQGLLSLNRNREFKKIVGVGGIISITLSLIFVPIYKAYATSVIVVVVEIYITLTMYYFLRKAIREKYAGI